MKIARMGAVWLLVSAVALAHSGSGFFTGLEQHPSLKAAAARLEGARLEAVNSANYLTIDASGGFVSRELAPADPCPFLSDPDPSNDVFCQILNPDIPETTSQSELALVLRAFPYGDVADRQKTAMLNYELARIDFAQSRSRLEKAALEAALQLKLAEDSYSLASEGLELAKQVLKATEIRYQKGAASERELRQARLSLEEAEVNLQNAAESRDLARLSLLSFTNSPPPPWPWPDLQPPADAIPPDVQKALVNQEMARVGLAHSKRSFLPVGEIRYQHNVSDNSAVGVSVESRTLSARVYYGYQSYADPTRSRTENELRLGLRLNITQDAWGGYEAAQARLQAADRALEAARKQAELELARLEMQIEQSRRLVALKKSALGSARADYEETSKRVEIGLSAPIEEQRAWLSYSRAQLELTKAEQDVVRAELNLLAYLGIPPSEVWK